MRITPFVQVVTLTGDRTVDKTDHDTFFVCDTTAAGGDITITIDEGLVGVRMIFRLKGGSANVLFAAGSGVTLHGNTTIAVQDGVAELIYDESTTDATLYGDVS